MSPANGQKEGGGRGGWALIAPRLLLFAVLASLAGCKGCGGCGEEDPPYVPPAPVPVDRAELTRGYAQRFPAGTHGILIARGFEDVARSFETIKERIRPFFDLGAVESEIRNTFGVDLHRHVTFREVGIAYEGGFALATVQQQPVLAVYLVDPAALVAKANDVLRRQPFNLRAPVRSERIATADVYLYARRTNQPVEVAVVVDRGFAFLISRVSTEVDLVDVARALAETTADRSLASHPDFQAQVARFDDYPGFLFADTAAASAFYSERLGDQLDASSAHALSELQANVTSVAGGAGLDGLELVFDIAVTATPALVEATRGIDAPPTAEPELERFVLPTTFAGVRLGANPRILWETFLRFQGETLRGQLQEAVTAAEADLGVSLTEDIAPALTGQAFIGVNRLAPLSLVRSEGIADYADGVDLLGVFQVADRERAQRVLDALVTASQGAYQRTAVGLNVRYSTGRGETGFGDLTLADDLLIVSAERMRRVVERLLRERQVGEGTGEGMAGLVPAAQELVRAPSATGVFMTFERLLDIVRIMNYPEVVQDLMGFLDTLVVRMESTETGLRVRGSLTIKPAE